MRLHDRWEEHVEHGPRDPAYSLAPCGLIDVECEGKLDVAHLTTVGPAYLASKQQPILLNFRLPGLLANDCDLPDAPTLIGRLAAHIQTRCAALHGPLNLVDLPEK